MPYYVPNNDRDLAGKICRTNVCKVCGRQLYVYLDLDSEFKTKAVYVACPDPEGHEGIARVYEPTRLETEGLDAYTETARREKLEKEYGEGKSRALATLPLSGILNKEQALAILRLVYPEVPDPEIIRTAIICRDFGLHPLMKEVYIIPFGQGDKRTWSTVLGINATRKMMARQGSFSYIDNTPRVMTEQEQTDILGEVQTDRICAITKLKTREGLEAQGYGHYLHKDTPYGMDKGNTKANMAFIRSERQAFSRLFPDALPQELEVIDEAYVETSVGKVEKATGEIVEAKETKAEPAPPPAGERDETKITEEQAAELDLLMKKTEFSPTAFGHYCNQEPRKWGIGSYGDLKVWQFEEIMAKLKKGQEAPPAGKLL